jgi:hypothetical protein
MQRLDHRGEIMEAPDGTTTCVGYDGLTHRLFAADNPNLIQALTRCGKRAAEVPGRGEVECTEPECAEDVP